MPNPLDRRKFLRWSGLSPAALAAASSQAAEAAGDRLEIESVEAIPVRLWTGPSRGAPPRFASDFDPARWRYRGPFAQLTSALVVIVKTRQGVTGFGLGAGGSAGAEIIHGHLRHLLVGANALNVELLWDQLYTSSNAYGRRGVFVMALSGVDNALWDIAGKHYGQPVHRLLGGAVKDRAPVYYTSTKPEDGLRLGMKHFKVPIRDGLFEGREGVMRTVEILREARQAAGSDATLMIDCGSRWDDVDYTIEMARLLEEVSLYFIEEPLSPDNAVGYERLVREIDSTLIAHGEHEYTHYGFLDLFRHHAIQVVQPDVSWCGGLTSLRRIAVMCQEHSVPFIPHRGGSLYGLPLVLTSGNCPLAESFGTGDSATDLMLAMSARFEDGFYLPPEKPGFGTELTETLVRDHAQ